MKYFIIILLLLTLSSCGTLTRGTTQAFTVTSTPSNAHVKFSSGELCMTPCTLQKKRSDAFTVLVYKEGYKTSNAAVIAQIGAAGAAAMAGNVLVGGFIGLGIDAYTGASKELVPNPLHMMLDVDEDSDAMQDGKRGKYYKKIKIPF